MILAKFEITNDESDRTPYKDIKAVLLTEHDICVNFKELGTALNDLGVESVKNSAIVRTKIKRKAESEACPSP